MAIPAGAALPREGDAFWNVPLAELWRRLDAGPDGLTTRQAAACLARYGPNLSAPPRHRHLLLDALPFFANPLVLVLLVASAVSAALGAALDAAIIAVIVGLSVVLNFVQVFRSERAVERLRRQIASRATVLRDARWTDVPVGQVVPGDVLRLSAGDLVPADGRLIEARDLQVNQAALTGESMPAAKSATEGPIGSSAAVDATNAVFFGSFIVGGAGRAIVARTGRATEFGHIAAQLAARPPETEFERGMHGFAVLITRTVFALVLFVFLVNALLQRDPLESFLFAVALAVGMTPEFLPMIVTVTLARGAVRMARRKVIVRNLAAIQNLGSMDILCSDKTGTLTAGTMSVADAVDALGRRSDEVLRLAALNSASQTGLRSPFDTAILARAQPADDNWRRVDEIPFDFSRRRLSVVFGLDERRVLITKGAPESILPLCTATASADGVVPLDDEGRTATLVRFRQFSADGYRVLAVAHRDVAPRPRCGVADEQSLTFDGFITFVDPIREDAQAAAAALRRDGVAVKILTGDNELVAGRVCRQVGLEVGRTVLGAEVAELSNAALGVVAERTVVFARVAPDQKERILRALKARGHAVGFLGDGINDAPSLRTADVGISVAGATDVARDAADIVLVEKSLDVLHRGVIEGRRSFGNVMKYVMMATSSNFGNVVSMAVASLFLPFLPLLPTQILLGNFLYDLAQIAIPTDRVDPTFIRKPRHWRIAFIRQFMLTFGPLSSLFDFATFAILLSILHAPAPLFRTGWFVESLVTQTIVIFVIRTAQHPLRSRPSRALVATTATSLAVGFAIAFTPVGIMLGFTPPPLTFAAVVLFVAAAYLASAEMVKHRFYRRHAL